MKFTINNRIGRMQHRERTIQTWDQFQPILSISRISPTQGCTCCIGRFMQQQSDAIVLAFDPNRKLVDLRGTPSCQSGPYRRKRLQLYRSQSVGAMLA